MNKERTWVSLVDESKPTRKFVELNNESVDKPKQKTQLQVITEAKKNVLFNTLIDSFMVFKSKHIFNESEDGANKILNKAKDIDGNTDDRMNHKFFGTPNQDNTEDQSETKKRGEWREFEKHAEIITNFLQVSKSEQESMIQALKKSFIALASISDNKQSHKANKDGTSVLDKGFKQLEKLDKIFQDSGIKGLDPAIRASKFLDLLSPFYKTKQRMKIDDPDNPGHKKSVERTIELPMDKEYDVSTFISMLDKRANRKLKKYIQGKLEFKLKDILPKAFQDENLDINEQMEIFRKIVNQGGYTKNNAQVGKGEIALAMFFGDCILPDDKGDIKLNGETIEIKGNDAGITERTTIVEDMIGMSYSDAISISSQLTTKNGLIELIKKYNLTENLECSPDEMKPTELFQKISDWQEILCSPDNPSKPINPDTEENQDDDLSAKDEPTPMDEAKRKGNPNRPKIEKGEGHALLFVLMFGLLSRAYFQKFDSMLILNTNDDISKDNSTSNLLNTNVIKLAKTKNDWYIDGINLLNAMHKNNMKVHYENRSKEGTFKATFLK